MGRAATTRMTATGIGDDAAGVDPVWLSFSWGGQPLRNANLALMGGRRQVAGEGTGPFSPGLPTKAIGWPHRFPCCPLIG